MYKIVLLSLLFMFFISCKKENVQETAKSKRVITQNEIIVKPVYNFTKDFILGKFNYKSDSSFIKINSNHSSKVIYLNKEVYIAFKEMYSLAKKDGIKLIVVSGTRNFYEQKYIWERKWNKYKNLKPLERAKKILEYSSMPTTSRHHWGTDIDLNNLNNSYFEKGKGKKEYEWLVKNANSFGFYQVYTNKKNGRTGYNLEKWHWSYLPLANKYLSYYNENINYSDISDFKGSELAKKTEMIAEYVNGISLKAKKFE
ncbi:M15 family metallopeptidase [Tenacibaculum maritimum]|nr:M15 family metallopeptidase [Tenacibaculum maritimum]MDB0600120.1 M15 family metallopeptidase [Tenacibaculum maritimum]MDB0610746.1 M15 family metallopeptidase [Tenacibaculum maritimum]